MIPILLSLSLPRLAFLRAASLVFLLLRIKAREFNRNQIETISYIRPDEQIHFKAYNIFAYINKIKFSGLAHSP